jgi:uncharacterized lipoprotein YddW (UPF0748 family)
MYLTSLRQFLTALFVILALTGMAAPAFKPSKLTPPEPLREYRAAWIATVANIDWPSTNSLTPAQQRAELVTILDRAVELKLNAIILQVRPGCDALYASKIEPWSEYLTGAMGRAPSPFYDPLSFAVQEAHARGLELHAWFNPYRARHASAKSPVSDDHISKKRPELVKSYGRYLWLDPGHKDVQDYSLSVVMDVVRRYDVDGIHFDDYFYPYKEKAPAGGELDFPDEESWKRFGATTGLSRDDWRRQNVNVFIERVYRSIKTEKPWVKFGISPFGIWRPGHPPQIKGFDQYDKLYADAKKWLNEGWCDYFAPQLYWAIDPPEQSFPVLLKWWAEQNSKSRHVVPGMNTTRAPRSWKPDEISNQIKISRDLKGSAGHIHWNMSSLMRSEDLRSELKRQVYQEPAIIPPVKWLSTRAPGKPQLTVTRSAGKPIARWKPAGTEKPALWLVQTRRNGQWSAQVLPGGTLTLDLKDDSQAVAVSAIDRFGSRSAPTVLEH